MKKIQMISYLLSLILGGLGTILLYSFFTRLHKDIPAFVIGFCFLLVAFYNAVLTYRFSNR